MIRTEKRKTKKGILFKIVLFLLVVGLLLALPISALYLATYPASPPKMIDSDGDRLCDDYEINFLGTNPNHPDTDLDWLDDSYELRIGTDPTKLDTDGDGIDDFNEYYTYPHLLNPNDPTDAERFLAMIPNVTAEAWDPFETSGDYWILSDFYGGRGNLGVFLTNKRIEVAKRDPLVQWIANQTEIEWETDPKPGAPVGQLTFAGEPWFDRARRLSLSEAVNMSDEIEASGNPSYYFTHGMIGGCVHTAYATRTIFELKGYECQFLHWDRAVWLGETVDHDDVEISKNGQVFAVAGSAVYRPEDYYQLYSHWGNLTKCKHV